MVQAKEIIKVNTQRGVGSAIFPLSHRYRTDRFYQPVILKDTFYTDTAISKFESINGNKYAQVFSSTRNSVAVHPILNKSMDGDALKEFTQDFGIPTHLYSDGSK